MEFYDAVNKRRTTRRFLQKEVDFEAVKRILEAGNKAPTWDHNRNWQYVILRTDEEKEYAFEARVIADVASPLVQQQVSNVVSFKLKTYKRRHLNLFLIGDAAPNGWNMGRAILLTRTEGSLEQFTWTGELKTGGFKFICQNTDGRWWPGYVCDPASSPEVTVPSYQGKLALYESDPGGDKDIKFNINTPGTYTVTLNTATLESWNVPYKKAEYSASPRGRSSAVIRTAASCIPEKLTIMFGIYTISSPAMMQTDRTEATLRTRSVPKIATMKINTPIRNVHNRYGSPVSSLSVAPPVAKATAGATHMTQIYSTSNKLEKIGANFL